MRVRSRIGLMGLVAILTMGGCTKFSGLGDSIYGFFAEILRGERRTPLVDRRDLETRSVEGANAAELELADTRQGLFARGGAEAVDGILPSWRTPPFPEPQAGAPATAPAPSLAQSTLPAPAEAGAEEGTEVLGSESNRTTAPGRDPAARQRAPQLAPQLAQGGKDRAFVVQLASVEVEERIDREWQRLREAFPDLLANRELLVEAADLGDRGVYHRIQTGPFTSQGDAEALCAALRGRNQDCLVVETEFTVQRTSSQIISDEEKDALFQQFLQWRQEQSP